MYTATIRHRAALKNCHTALLDNTGLTIRVSKLPDYVAYAGMRDRLGRMHPIRRWLSFRLRRQLWQLQLGAQSAILNEVLSGG